MSIINAILLGIIEGFTEFLPISSTAHLILASKLLGIASTDFLKTFEVAIQSGAILSVAVLYAKRLIIDRRMLIKLAVAFLPSAVLGLLFYKIIKNILMDSTGLILASMAIGGAFIIIYEKYVRKIDSPVSDIGQISYKSAFLIGVCQSLAMIPGVSRAAATIVGGNILGLDKKTAVEFSFLLAIPTMAAATGLDLIKNRSILSSVDVIPLAVGFIISFISAMVAVKWLLNFVKTKDFTVFGVYRIVAALALLLVWM